MARKKQTKTVNETVTKVLADFKMSWDYTTGSWHDRWENNNNLYNNKRVKRGYDGITDTFVPMTFSTIETMTSALFGSKPRFNYIPPQERPNQNTDILNSLVDYFWEKDMWSIKVINWGRDMLKYGTSVIYVHWHENCPRIINVPIRDFFIDPRCNNLESASFMGRRYLTTKEELESFEIVDLDKSTDEETFMKKKYKNIDKIKSAGTSEKSTQKERLDMWYGSTVPEGDQVEVIEYWTKDKVISIANRTVVIEDIENFYKTKARDNGEEYPEGLLPFAVLRNYVDPALFYAKGDIDFILDSQELLNDLTNQNVDNVTFANNQMYTLDPKYASRINEVENLPGAVYPFEAGALTPIAQRGVDGSMFTERMNLKTEIRETTASNEVVKGVGQEGGKVTATEIQAQIAGAGQRMGLKITQIEDEGFYQLANIVFHMIQLYITEPMLVRIMGRDGVRWEKYDPYEFKSGEYQPRVQLEASLNSEKQQDATIAKELLAAFLGDEQVNQTELKKLALLKGFDLDPDEVQTLMTPEPMPEMGMDMMPPEMMDLPPEMMDVQPDPLTGELMPMMEEPMGVI
jgi:hypothetical protein